MEFLMLDFTAGSVTSSESVTVRANDSLNLCIRVDTNRQWFSGHLVMIPAPKTGVTGP